MSIDGLPPWLADWLSTVTVLDALLWVAGVVALVLFVRKGWPWLRRTARAFLHFAEIVDAVQDLPEFIERTDATLEKQNATLEQQSETLDEQNRQIADIHHEVHFNNGSSVKDAVVRVEVDVKKLLTERHEDG